MIILHGKVEDGRYLIIDRLQIGLRVRLGGLLFAKGRVRRAQHLVLPLPDSCRRNRRDGKVLEKGQDLQLDDKLLIPECRRL